VLKLDEGVSLCAQFGTSFREIAMRFITGTIAILLLAACSATAPDASSPSGSEPDEPAPGTGTLRIRVTPASPELQVIAEIWGPLEPPPGHVSIYRGSWTDYEGRRIYADLLPGNYAVGLSQIKRWVDCGPGPLTTTVTVGQSTEMVFTCSHRSRGEAHLRLVVPPTDSAMSGVPFERQPVVQLQDSAGNPVAIAGVHVWPGGSAGTAPFPGDRFTYTDRTGRAVFQGLGMRGYEGTRRLSFFADGYAPTSTMVILKTPPTGG
jgi:hypothetical protein